MPTRVPMFHQVVCRIACPKVTPSAQVFLPMRLNGTPPLAVGRGELSDSVTGAGHAAVSGAPDSAQTRGVRCCGGTQRPVVMWCRSPLPTSPGHPRIVT